VVYLVVRRYRKVDIYLEEEEMEAEQTKGEGDSDSHS
jgi:hypothetical protein